MVLLKNHEDLTLYMPIDTFELNEMVFDYDPNEVYSDWIESVREYQDEDE